MKRGHPRRRKHLVGNARVAAALDDLDRGLSKAQDALGGLMSADDRGEAPARTSYLDGLYSVIEKERRKIRDRAWRKS